MIFITYSDELEDSRKGINSEIKMPALWPAFLLNF